MTKRESDSQKIARLATKKFPSLSTSGTDILQLVRFVLKKKSALERARAAEIGDDVRDYVNTSYFLRLLSSKAITEIEYLGRGEIQRRLREKVYPFSQLDKKTREKLLHLPNSWIHGAAAWLLQTRESISQGFNNP